MAEIQALYTLRENANLMVLPADKCNATVILNTADYMRKISHLLEDPSYRRMAKDPTLSMDRRTELLLKRSSILDDVV
jgi:hypothetical protein